MSILSNLGCWSALAKAQEYNDRMEKENPFGNLTIEDLEMLKKRNDEMNKWLKPKINYAVQSKT